MLNYWIWLAQRRNVKLKTRLELLSQLGSPKAVYDANAGDYRAAANVSEDDIAALADKNLEDAEAVLTKCKENNVHILTLEDPAYPQRLKNIYDPPLLLYYKGTLPNFDAIPAIGVVGTRKASMYGVNMSFRLGYEITKCGGLVVSGLAKGVDAAAMQGALVADGSTVGVLGTAIDKVYPACNRQLFKDTESFGCILSEYAPGEETRNWTFLARNRIVSGLSCGVVVTEAPERSGALNTAKNANEEGRDVYALPGNVGVSTSAGTNQLLAEGAKLITCGWDVMREYEGKFPDAVHHSLEKAPEKPAEMMEKVTQEPLKPRKKKNAEVHREEKSIDNPAEADYIDLSKILQGLSADERLIAATIGHKEMLLDDVIAQSGLRTSRVLALLTVLELRKVVRRLPGKRLALRL